MGGKGAFLDITLNILLLIFFMNNNIRILNKIYKSLNLFFYYKNIMSTCKGTKKDNTKCTFKSKQNGFCLFHVKQYKAEPSIPEPSIPVPSIPETEQDQDQDPNAAPSIPDPSIPETEQKPDIQITEDILKLSEAINTFINKYKEQKKKNDEHEFKNRQVKALEYDELTNGVFTPVVYKQKKNTTPFKDKIFNYNEFPLLSAMLNNLYNTNFKFQKYIAGYKFIKIVKNTHVDYYNTTLHFNFILMNDNDNTTNEYHAYIKQNIIYKVTKIVDILK
jgi:hypothetical protein